MFAFHIDMNFACFRKESLLHILDLVSGCGFDTVIWEIENKVRLETLGAAVHPEALSKADFREILSYAQHLGLESFPLLQTLGHAEYVLKVPAFQQFRENGSPDCYCTSNPSVRTFLRQLMNEILELFDHPRYFHLGGDEAYNFATCPTCSQRDSIAMFCEHESWLAGPLWERGITPCLWSDMLRKHPETRGRLDRRFLIWFWNYSYTDDWDNDDLLRQAGYRLVICPASSSAGDSPFLPQWNKHAGNIAGAVQNALKHRDAGVCITSWSIRMGLKCTQLPLWQLGMLMFRRGMDFTAAEQQVRDRFFSGIDPEISGAWERNLFRFTGVQWTPYKDGLPPPPGHFAHELKNFPEIHAELPEKVAALIRSSEPILKTMTENKSIAPEIVQAAALRLQYLRILENLLTEHSVSAEDIRVQKEEFRRFLELEQTPQSAADNATLIYDPLIEYAENDTGICI